MVLMSTTTTRSRVTVRMSQQAKRVEFRRKRLGLSQGELAKQAGVSTSAVGMIERGNIPAKSAALPAVLSALAELEIKP